MVTDQLRHMLFELEIGLVLRGVVLTYRHRLKKHSRFLNCSLMYF